jgi:hypothetical protein
MTCRRASAPFLLLLLFSSSVASAQSPSAVLLVSASRSDGVPITSASVSLSVTDPMSPTTVASAEVSSDTIVSFVLPPGAYTLLASAADVPAVTTSIVLKASEATRYVVTFAGPREPATSLAAETDRWPLSYQAQFDKRLLGALPHSRTAWSLLETAHPFLVSDRIDGGGLTTGEQPRLGGQGSSATQTTYRLHGIDVTDPDSTGQSLFFADLRGLDTVTVTAASLDASSPGPSPTVDMILPRPAVTWTGAAEFTGAPAGMQAEAGDIAPIERLKSWMDGGATAGGGIGATSSLFLSARAATVDRVERESPETLEGATRALTARVTKAGSGQSVDVLGAFSSVMTPLIGRARFADRDLTQDDGSLIVHGAWERARGRGQFSIGGGFQRASRDADVSATEPGGIIERLKDGPPMALFAGASRIRQRWSLGARAIPGTRRWLNADHVLDAGVSIAGVHATGSAGAQPAFGELVNGVPARVWEATSLEWRRSATTLSAFVTDRMPIGDALTVNAALRLDLDRGSADGAADDIAWTTLLPRVHARWRPLGRGAFSITGGYGWYAHRLPLGYLSVGDPAGVSGTMFRWDDRDSNHRWTADELTPVAAIGLCCVGAEASRIDQDLRRPVTREFRIGGEHTLAGWRIGVTGLDRREDNLVTLVNTGVTLADYTVTYVDDPGVDIAGLSGSAPLPIYNRRPESALRDRYLLTNTSAPASRFQSLDIVIENQFLTKWFVRFGGTAYRSEGDGANRGYRSDENDQGLLGEVFVTPNAQTNARGRLFYDRGYMMKVMGGYTAPRVLSGAFVARYQDGQPFARLLLADGLTQGRDLVQTYWRGGQRFTYTVTLDARIAADWRISTRRSAGIVFEAFNLLNLANEVEEDIVTGPAFRTITAVQPPRVLRIGARITF